MSDDRYAHLREMPFETLAYSGNDLLKFRRPKGRHGMGGHVSGAPAEEELDGLQLQRGSQVRMSAHAGRRG